MIEGFVLAGGMSRRMGIDKARLQSGGVPMAVRMMETLQGVCDRVRLVRRQTPDGLPWLDRMGAPVEVLREPSHQGAHPLWGVGAALSVARGPLAMLVPCDLPHLPVDALKRMAAHGPCVATDGQHVHPLVAILPTDWSERAYSLARQGEPARELVNDLPRVTLNPEWLADVNSPSRVSVEIPLWQRCMAGLSDRSRAQARIGERSRQRMRGMVSLQLDAQGSQQESG